MTLLFKASSSSPSIERTRRRQTATGSVMAIGAAVAMGSTAPALKSLAQSDLTPVNLIQARTVVGAAVLMMAAVMLHRRQIRVARSDWWLVGVYGVFSLAINQVIFTMSLSRLPVGVALLLEYTSPLMVALWMRWVQKVHLPRMAWLGIVIAFCGLALTAQVWAGFTLDSVGVLMGLVAALTMASRFLLAEKGLRRYDPLILSAWGSAVGALCLVLLAPVQPFDFKAIGQTVDLGGSKVSVFVVLLWIGLVGMAGGVILGVSAQQRISPASANLVLSLEVVVGTALAAWLLAESLTVPQLVGATTMLLGIVAAQWGMTRVSNDRRPSS